MTNLILKSDGLIYVCDIPEIDFEEIADSGHSFADGLNMEKQLRDKAISEAVLCQDQEQARSLIIRSGHPQTEITKNIPYHVIDHDFEVRYQTHEGIPIKGKRYFKQSEGIENMKDGIPVAVLKPTVVETEIDEQEEIFDGMFSLYFDLISDKQLSMYEACVEIQKRYTISKKP